MQVQVDIPALVRAIRRSRGLTQEQLARELGVTFSTVNGWENGKHRPLPLLVKTLCEIAGKLGLEIPEMREKAEHGARTARRS
jgi:putative transcriptional regulator